ncbi:hypothetical protein CGCFRS4_v015868 [Colletotrichum fructicola]|nr:hypothetical protein CGCFRS4_v015868 [Colletotrichum fructicola]
MTINRTKRRPLSLGARTASQVRRLSHYANLRSKKVPVRPTIAGSDAVKPARDLRAENTRNVINSGLGKSPLPPTNDQSRSSMLTIPKKQSIAPIATLYDKLGFNRNGKGAEFKKSVESILKKRGAEYTVEACSLAKWGGDQSELRKIAQEILSEYGERFWPAAARESSQLCNEG